jgi:hypothetical protein
MAEISPLLAIVIVILWPVFIGVCTWKYLRAFRQKKRLDTWIWFFAWCFCLTAIEWWVWSVRMFV